MTFKATPWVCSFCLQYEYIPQQFAVDFRIWRDDLHEKGSVCNTLKEWLCALKL